MARLQKKTIWNSITFVLAPVLIFRATLVIPFWNDETLNPNHYFKSNFTKSNYDKISAEDAKYSEIFYLLWI